MTYIFMIAGKGSRLNPLTLTYPKTLYKLDKDTTVLKRMVTFIRKYDKDAKIVAVTGFAHDVIEKNVEGVVFVQNPFYEVTNSIASLWFARDYMQGDVVLINGDIVMEEALIRDVMCKPVSRPTVMMDASIKKDGDYNVQINGERVVVMSKGLDEYAGEFAGVAMFNPETIPAYRQEMELMIEEGMYTQWYENVLVQMIFRNDFALYYTDVSDYKWTEIDCVSDLVFAKKIHSDSPMPE